LKPRWVLAICLLLLVFSVPHLSPVRAASGQPFSIVYLSPVSYNATSGSSFTVNVMLNLTAGQSVSGFNVKLNYGNPQPDPVVIAKSVSYAGNIFGDASSNFVSTECVPPIIICQTADPTDAESGWVHFSALPESGNPVSGPLSKMLFSVAFYVENVRNSSLIHIDTADVANAGSGLFATTQFIPIVKEDAIFSNSGVTAFFNYLPTDTPSVVAGHPNRFDASGSFANNSSAAITSYSWNFGDMSTGSGPIIPHTFRSPGTYSVTLNVTDLNGGKGSIHRMLTVEPPLGALLLTVFSLQKVLQSGVLVRIFNSSNVLPFENATTDSSGQVAFNNLLPGVYTLAFSGPTVKHSNNATETILAGWTTQGSVGLEVYDPPPSSPTPWYGDIVFLGSLGGALGVFGFGLFLRRRSMRKKLRANRASLKKK
jgi:PKD repeat protein